MIAFLHTQIKECLNSPHSLTSHFSQSIKGNVQETPFTLL